MLTGKVEEVTRQGRKAYNRCSSVEVTAVSNGAQSLWAISATLSTKPLIVSPLWRNKRLGIYPPASFYLSLGEDCSQGLNSTALPAWKTVHTPARDLVPSACLELLTGGLQGRLNGFRQSMESIFYCCQFYGEFLSIFMSPALVQIFIPS